MEGEIRNIRTILDDVPRVGYLLNGGDGTKAYIKAMLRLTIVGYLDAMRPYMMRLEPGADPRGYIRSILSEYTTSKLPYPYGPVTREQLTLLFCQYMVMEGDDVTIKRNLDLVIAAANFIGYTDGLIIQRSQIPGAGMGLWTTRQIPRKAPITLYGGIAQDKQTKVLDEEYIAKAYHGGKKWFVDAATFFRLGEKGRWINDTRNSHGLENNARLYQVAPNAPKNKDPIKHPGVKMTKTATRNVYSDMHIPVDIYVACMKTKSIEEGEEIFLTYGQSYWGAGATQYDEQVSESTQESETAQKGKQQDDEDEDSEFIYSTEVSQQQQQQQEEEEEDIPSTEEDEEKQPGSVITLSPLEACIQCHASPWQYLAENNFLHRFCSHECACTFYSNQ